MISSSSLGQKFVMRSLAAKRRLLPASKVSHLKACVFKLDGFGDFVLALGAIRELLRYFGEQNCALVIYSPLTELAQQEFPKATIIALKKFDGGPRDCIRSFFQESKIFRRYEFETLICLRYQRTQFQELILSWINVKQSFGFQNVCDPRGKQDIAYRFTETLPLENVGTGSLCGELDRHKVIVSRTIGTKLQNEKVIPQFGALIPTQGEALIVTPLSRLAVKDYPQAQLLRALVECCAQVKRPIIFSGGPGDERTLSDMQLAAESFGLSAKVEVSKTVLQFAKKIAAAGAILSVDTFAAHIATALDKPTVVLLGGGHFGHFGPWRKSSKQIWLSNPLPCFQCNWECIHPKALCITEIAPQRIAEALRSVIDQK